MAKFKVGDKVVISPLYKAKYNCINTVGEVLSFQKIGDRMRYYVHFEGKNFNSFYYSYELEHAKKTKTI